MTGTFVSSGRTGHWDWRRLEASGAMAEIVPARGAIVTRWRVPRGDELVDVLWLADGYFDQVPGGEHRLSGGIPFLFPVSGPTALDGIEDRYLIGDQAYDMPGHGFGPVLPYEVDAVVEGESASVILVAKDDESTRAIYPFEFVSTVAVTLGPRILRISWKVVNRSSSTMPLAPGLHPYFRLPMGAQGKREDVRVETSSTRRYLPNEPVRIWSGNAEDLSSGTLQLADLPVGRPFTVGDYDKPEYTIVDEANGASLRATWPKPDGEGPYLNLWTPDAETPAWCVEPFLGLQNALNNGRGLIELSPGETWDWWFELEALL